MPTDYRSLLKRLLPMIEGDAAPAVRTLKNKAAQEAEQAIQLRNSLGDLDVNTLRINPEHLNLKPEVLKIQPTLPIPAVAKEDSVLSEAFQKAKMAPIEEADVLSPKLNNIDLPLTPEAQKLNKYKAALAALAVGGGGALAVDAGMFNGGGTPPPQAAQLPPPPASIPAEIQQVLAQDKQNLAQLNEPSEMEKTLMKLRSLSARPSSDEASSNAAPILRDVDFGSAQSVANMEGLRNAQQGSREAILANTIGRAGTAMVAQASGVKNQFDPIFEAQLKEAQGIPEQYMKQVQFEKEDPNSPMSKGYKDIAKAMGFNIMGQASAADLERVIPQLANVYNQQEAQKARGEQAKENRLARRDAMELQLAAAKENRAATRDTKTEVLKNKFIENAQKVTGKEFEKLQKIENAFDSIEQAQGDKMGASDVSILYNFIKSQDPNSVVREGEIALGQKGQSLGGKLRTMTLGQMSGELLDPQFRKDVLKISRRLKDQGHNSYDQAVQVIRDTAKQRYHMDDDELTLIDPVLNRQKKAAVPAPLQTTPAASPHTMKLIQSRSDEENKKRLEELRMKFGK